MSLTLIAIVAVATACYAVVTILIVRAVRRMRRARAQQASIPSAAVAPACPHDGTRVLLPGLGGLWIEVRRGQQVQTAPLVGNQVVLGTHEGADIRIEDPFVSRRHASLRVLPDGRVRVTDLDSTNGTLVNGHRIEARILEAGDEIRLGEAAIRIFQLGTDAPSALHRAA